MSVSLKSILPCLLLAACAFGYPAQACINDRDTLAEEAKASPDVVYTIVGRFPRNPPLYYQMRIARVEKELRQNPRQLPLYDDIAVAYDRIGNDKQALVWIEKKKGQLQQLGYTTKDKAQREQWYRYYANAGTFHAHNWIKTGANRKDMSELRLGRDQIEKATDLKTNAHFGREMYQLKVMEWILKPPPYDPQKPLPDILENDLAFKMGSSGLIYEESSEPDAVKGFGGLIRLGNAWESVDVFYALANELGSQQKVAVSMLAMERVNELLDHGRGTILPGQPKGWALKERLAKYNYSSSPGAQNLPAMYHALRMEADNWQQARTAYMMARLQAGQHPDTDKSFWNDYSETLPPSLEQIQYDTYEDSYKPSPIETAKGLGWVGVLFIVLVCSMIYMLFSLRSRRLKGA